MKHLSESISLFFLFLFLTALLFGPAAFKGYLDAYNTQKDRELFVKTYEIVLECRKSYTISSIMAAKMCGEIPTFVSQVS
jgi:hypothetical protein